MSESFDFPTFGEIELVEGNNDEGPVPRRPPGLPVAAGQSPSTFRLRPVGKTMTLVELTVFDVPNFAYDPPPGHVPQGDLQWFVKHPGDGRFAKYGDPFRYRQEKDNFWDRVSQ